MVKDQRRCSAQPLQQRKPKDPATHLENRIGEPLANPYLYMASQIHAGLDGMARKLDPGPSADAPYEKSAEPLPASLAEAIAALKGSGCFRKAFGEAFVAYYARIKEFEIVRCGERRPVGQSDGCHRLGAQGILRPRLRRGKPCCAIRKIRTSVRRP